MASSDFLPQLSKQCNRNASITHLPNQDILIPTTSLIPHRRLNTNIILNRRQLDLASDSTLHTSTDVSPPAPPPSRHRHLPPRTISRACRRSNRQLIRNSGSERTRRKGPRTHIRDRRVWEEYGSCEGERTYRSAGSVVDDIYGLWHWKDWR